MRNRTQAQFVRCRDGRWRGWGGALVALALVALAASGARGQGVVRSATEAQQPSDAPRVIALVRGLRSARGHVRGGLYGSQATFTHGGQEVATCSATIRDGVARCNFGSVPAGRYAMGMMHDEDDDTVFDQGFMGIPEEGYGFSRDARGTLGAPSFESAAFDFDGTRTRTLTVTMRYGI